MAPPWAPPFRATWEPWTSTYFILSNGIADRCRYRPADLPTCLDEGRTDSRSVNCQLDQRQMVAFCGSRRSFRRSCLPFFWGRHPALWLLTACPLLPAGQPLKRVGWFEPRAAITLERRVRNNAYSNTPEANTTPRLILCDERPIEGYVQVVRLSHRRSA